VRELLHCAAVVDTVLCCWVQLAATGAKATAVQQLRLKQAMLNVLWVILQRWDGLQEYARASNLAWPLPTAKQDAYSLR
jgi:hypothetical protein